MDYSPPGSSVHGISQSRILKWVAIFSSRESSQHKDETHVSCIGRQILYHWTTWDFAYVCVCVCVCDFFLITDNSAVKQMLFYLYFRDEGMEA